MAANALGHEMTDTFAKGMDDVLWKEIIGNRVETRESLP